jgi:hypothetical protein
MSRSGYHDDIDNWSLIKWRGRVASATRGKRGQKLLRDILAALDAMPVKRLIAHELATEGEFCTLGALGAARGLDMSSIDPEDRDAVAATFDVAMPLVAEIVWHNDDHIDDYEWVEVEVCGPIRPYYPEYGRHRLTVRAPAENVEERRWHYMRSWIASQIKEQA